jgi:hypothetical protein
VICATTSRCIAPARSAHMRVRMLLPGVSHHPPMPTASRLRSPASTCIRHRMPRIGRTQSSPAVRMRLDSYAAVSGSVAGDINDSSGSSPLAVSRRTGAAWVGWRASFKCLSSRRAVQRVWRPGDRYGGRSTTLPRESAHVCSLFDITTSSRVLKSSRARLPSHQLIGVVPRPVREHLATA